MQHKILHLSNIANLDFNKAGFDLLARYDNLDDSFRERYERVFDSLFRKDWRTVYNTADVDQLSSVEWIDYNSTLFEKLKRQSKNSWYKKLNIRIKRRREYFNENANLDGSTDDSTTFISCY